MPYQKVTFLDDLPDIDTMELQKPKTSRYIRNSHNAPPESGMSMYAQPPPTLNNNYDPMYTPPTHMAYNMGHNYRPTYEEPFEPQMNSTSSCNCQDLYNHYSECPVCQKFYRSDCTVYLVIIAILMITCALLAKKVLNV